MISSRFLFLLGFLLFGITACKREDQQKSGVPTATIADELIEREDDFGEKLRQELERINPENDGWDTMHSMTSDRILISITSQFLVAEMSPSSSLVISLMDWVALKVEMTSKSSSETSASASALFLSRPVLFSHLPLVCFRSSAAAASRIG